MKARSTDTPFDVEAHAVIFREHLDAIRSQLRVLEGVLEKTRGATRGPSRARGTLFDAALDGDAQKVTKLLSAADVNPNERNADGETPLLRAAYKPDNVDVVILLLRAGADPNIADNDGNTPLLVCVDDERLPMARKLAKAGANVHVRNVEGDTPLTNAACWGSSRAVKLLLDHGADASAPDGIGVTAAEIARQQGHGVIARTLASISLPKKKPRPARARASQ